MNQKMITVPDSNTRRFGFGRNWLRFARHVDSQQQAAARQSLQSMLGRDDLKGLAFLDIGSGSGLFSRAAYELGARVTSFDYDADSVACTQQLRDKADAKPTEWEVAQGSVLDADYLKALERQFDVVYSWGVLHHTGHMWQAMENSLPLVKPGGQLFIAIYNDQGWKSRRYWVPVKRAYNASLLSRAILVAVHWPYFVGLRWLARALRGQLREARGMRLWPDMLDWLGGYPFEVAKPEEIIDFYHQRGFQLQRLITCGGRGGCNQFVFRRNTK